MTTLSPARLWRAAAMLLAVTAFGAGLHGSRADQPPHPRRAGDFLPSRDGFAFTNAFTGSPMPTGLEGLGALVGVPARFGLCGGMSSAAADFFLAGRTVPAGDKPPVRGTALYAYLYRRQVDSLGAALAAPVIFADLMRRPDEGPMGTQHLSLGALPGIVSDLEAGRPVLLGLVYARAGTGEALWENHQVLAFRADVRRGGGADLHVYDPNFPRSDAVVIECVPRIVGTLVVPGALCHTLPVVGVACTLRVPAVAGRPARHRPVRGLFAMPYEPVAPPEDL